MYHLAVAGGIELESKLETTEEEAGGSERVGMGWDPLPYAKQLAFAHLNRGICGLHLIMTGRDDRHGSREREVERSPDSQTTFRFGFTGDESRCGPLLTLRPGRQV